MSESKKTLTMDIRSMLSTTPPRESHPPASPSGYPANNSQRASSDFTPSINFYSTTAITERPILDLDTNAEGTLPHDGFDDMYDDSRHNSPEVNAGSGNGLSDLPPFQESNVRSEPLIIPPNSQLINTTPGAPTSGASVPGTTARTSSGAVTSALPLSQRNSPVDYRPLDRNASAPYSSINIHETTSRNSRDEPHNLTPWPRTTSPVASRQLETAAISSNRIPNNATNAWTAQPNAAARSSNRISDGARIVDVDAWEARRRRQVTYLPSYNSPQASSRTLSGSEQTAVGFLASNFHGRDISRVPSGSRTESNAKYENGKPFNGPVLEEWLYVDIETASREKFDDQLGAALLCRYAIDCHKSDKIRKGKQKQGDPPLPPLFPSIKNDSAVETESPEEDEANMDYIYNVRPHALTWNGTGLKTIQAHPGNAVWPLVKTRLGSVNDPRTWETACDRCSTVRDSRMAHHCPSCTEQREQTISLEEAAVEDNKNQTEGAARYNQDLYTTTSSIRQLSIEPYQSRAELGDMAALSNALFPLPSFQAPSSGFNDKGKQKANGDGIFNESQPTPALASAQATSSRSRRRVTRQTNGNVNSNANGTQTRPSPPPPPRPRSRPSHRTRPLTASEPEVPSPAPAPAASSRRRSQRHIPSPHGRMLDRANAHNPDQGQTFYNNKTEEANNEDDEQGRRGGKKEKKSVSWDPKENGQTNSKRKASEAVEDVDGGWIRARARRKTASNSSNGPNQLGASQQNRRSAASDTLAAGLGTGVGAGTSISGTNLTIPDLVAAQALDPVTYATSPSTLASPATPPRREGSSARRARLTLYVAAEANPEHPDHEAYLARREASRRRSDE